MSFLKSFYQGKNHRSLPEKVFFVVVVVFLRVV